MLSGDILYSLGQGVWVSSVNWHPIHPWLAATFVGEGSFTIWDLKEHYGLQIIRDVAGDRSRCCKKILWHPTESMKFATASRDKTVRVWQLIVSPHIRNENDDGNVNGNNYEVEPILTFSKHTKGVSSISWNADGSRLVSGDDNGDIFLWDSTTGDVLHQLKDEENPLGMINSIHWHPLTNKIVIGTMKGILQIWDGSSPSLLKTIEDDILINEHDENGNANNIQSVRWSPDGTKLAVGIRNDGIIPIWDSESYELIVTLEGHRLAVHDIDWHPTRWTLLSGGWDQTVKLWEVTTDQLIQSE